MSKLQAIGSKLELCQLDVIQMYKIKGGCCPPPGNNKKKKKKKK